MFLWRCMVNVALRGHLNRQYQYIQTVTNVANIKPFLIGSVILTDPLFIRNYAKGKDKKKEDKGKGHKKKIEINEAGLNEHVKLDKIKLEMEKNIERLKENFIKYLSLRTASGSIENTVVHYENKKYQLMELAQIIRNNPKTIIINMSSFPQAIPAALKSLSQTGMNLNPQQDGTTIYIPIPKVTKEHRETLAKNAKSHFIKCRDGIRDVQTKTLKTLKTKENDGLSVDLSKEYTEQIKFIADEYVSQADLMLKQKQTELLDN